MQRVNQVAVPESQSKKQRHKCHSISQVSCSRFEGLVGFDRCVLLCKLSMFDTHYLARRYILIDILFHVFTDLSFAQFQLYHTINAF